MIHRFGLLVLFAGLSTSCRAAREPNLQSLHANVESIRLEMRSRDARIGQLNDELEACRTLIEVIRRNDADRPKNRERMQAAYGIARDLLLELSKLHSENAVQAANSASFLQAAIDRANPR